MNEIYWGKPEPPKDAITKAAHELVSAVNPHDAHVGVGDNELVLYVTRSKSIAKRLSAVLGATYEGFPLRVEYVGKIKPA